MMAGRMCIPRLRTNPIKKAEFFHVYAALLVVDRHCSTLGQHATSLVNSTCCLIPAGCRVPAGREPDTEQNSAAVLDNKLKVKGHSRCHTSLGVASAQPCAGETLELEHANLWATIIRIKC